MFQRLLPDRAADLSADSVASGLRLGDLAPPDRPYLVLNMAATADGRVAIGGRSAPVAGSADRELFHHLRTQADAVLVGAGTARVERYGRVVKNEELSAKRAREGVRPEPLAVLVSGSLDLPPDLPILRNPAAQVAVVTATDGEIEGATAQVTYLRQPLRAALRTLRSDHGIRSIVCEGGPHLNSSLLREGLVDELFLCLSPRIAGDPSQPATVEGSPLPDAIDMSLVSLHEADEHTFFRYRLR